MSEYVKIIEHDDSISVCFYIEEDKILKIGDKINEINDEAYMNGYNWEALLNCYLEKKFPKILKNIETDPEAGMYAAYFELNPDNKKNAEKLVNIITELIEDENKLYEYVKNNGNEIEWD